MHGIRGLRIAGNDVRGFDLGPRDSPNPSGNQTFAVGWDDLDLHCDLGCEGLCPILTRQAQSPSEDPPKTRKADHLTVGACKIWLGCSLAVACLVRQ